MFFFKKLGGVIIRQPTLIELRPHSVGAQEDWVSIPIRIIGDKYEIEVTQR